MHVLLQNAKRYIPNNAVSGPDGYEYSPDGYWVSAIDGEPFITSGMALR